MERKNTDESYIPDYQTLFEDDPKHTGGGGRVLRKLLKENRRKIYISSLYYIVKASPVWVIPVITAAIINAVTGGGKNVMGEVWMYMGILLVLLLQNIPMHVLYAR